MKAQLILENGMRFSGTLFGAEKNIVGEVVFTTGMTGYQELLLIRLLQVRLSQ